MTIIERHGKKWLNNSDIPKYDTKLSYGSGDGGNRITPLITYRLSLGEGVRCPDLKIDVIGRPAR